MAIPWTNVSNTSVLLSTQRPALPYLSATTQDIMRTFQFLCYGIIGEVIALFGIGTNIVNITCFVKQGFKESINISLLGLAASDLGCLLTSIWVNFCMTLAFQEADLSFDPLETQYLTAAMPHMVFTRATAVITAFITLERCLCITMPLKVKSIFTPRKVVVINVCIFITLIISFSPVYFTTSLGMKYVPERNRTILGLVSTEHRVVIEQVSLAINSVLIPSSALFIIIVCMVTMVITLRKQTKWRQAHRGAVNVDISSEREDKLSKMIVMVSTLFVACFCPSVIVLLYVTMDPDFNVGGKYVHVSVFAYGFSTVAESANSSMNIFIYYKMSSRYRSYFHQIFRSKNANSHEIKQGLSTLGKEL